MDLVQLREYWPLLVPLFLLQFILAVTGIVNVIRREPNEIRGGKKWPWIIVCVLFGILGPLVYFVFGRKDRSDDDDDDYNASH
ncbi:MAG TPA: negative regulator of sigma-Y activity [Firmicutes bacterium]|jgi:uncharacterized integral membrane protein|nr:negative regulator of sigma-Y activity [Bacillota bacterium]HAZ21250.1 negative regulator of sigma-Y activity [Bacillota bacterium]HBE06312.1 negative regulator of sigma-Y activity [Bacillota bacterium]HBG44035.1 negative regulator of sigma-Y activity [Bacillota bacterium]HBL50844.1 negative regulator of sigma-Y activity [Bacillota bacterium]